jgi:hypothetical protein
MIQLHPDTQPLETSMRASLRLLSAPLLLVVALGQAAPPATQPSPLRITLMDGSAVVGMLSVGELTIETDYGTLKVPVDQIQAFAPGIRSHPDFEAKLNAALKDLSSEAFADREKAQETLVKIGPDLHRELERQLKTAEAEKQMRLQKILEEFEAAESDEDAAPGISSWRPEDVIATANFTIVGRITTNNFAVTSPYGTLQLKLADVREVRRENAAPEEIRKSIAVSGNTAAQRTYTSSNIRLNKGDQVWITAGGQINMTPFGNMQSGPDGGPNFGMQQPDNIPGGTLIARISTGSSKGEVIKVGSKHNFTAPRAGTLEFSIAIPGDFGGNQFPGEYQVKIRVLRKPG